MRYYSIEIGNAAGQSTSTTSGGFMNTPAWWGSSGFQGLPNLQAPGSLNTLTAQGGRYTSHPAGPANPPDPNC
jgi:hypothetical protein